MANDAQMPELLPCPFCGGEAKVYGPVGWYRQYGISHSCRVFYGGSGDFTLGAKTEEEAIAHWNRRDLCASGQQVRALMERLPRYDIDVDGDIMPDPTGEYLERSDVLAALTPATQPAGEAVPVAWAYYWPDGGLMDVLTTAVSPYETLRQVPLFDHPPQPSETVAKALEEARSGLCSYTGGPDGACSETIKRIDAALRALKGGEP